MSLPGDTFPGVGHFVLAFVAAEGDAHFGIVAIGDGPFADFAADIVIFGVAAFAQVVIVGRIEEDAAGADISGDAGGEDALPVAATDTDATEAGGELAHVNVKARHLNLASQQTHAVSIAKEWFLLREAGRVDARSSALAAALPATLDAYAISIAGVGWALLGEFLLVGNSVIAALAKFRPLLLVHAVTGAAVLLGDGGFIDALLFGEVGPLFPM